MLPLKRCLRHAVIDAAPMPRFRRADSAHFRRFAVAAISPRHARRCLRDVHSSLFDIPFHAARAAAAIMPIRPPAERRRRAGSRQSAACSPAAAAAPAQLPPSWLRCRRHAISRHAAAAPLFRHFFAAISRHMRRMRRLIFYALIAMLLPLIRFAGPPPAVHAAHTARPHAFRRA